MVGCLYIVLLWCLWHLTFSVTFEYLGNTVKCISIHLRHENCKTSNPDKELLPKCKCIDFSESYQQLCRHASAVFIFTDSGTIHKYVSNTLRTNHVNNWKQEKAKCGFPNILLIFHPREKSWNYIESEPEHRWEFQRVIKNTFLKTNKQNKQPQNQPCQAF